MVSHDKEPRIDVASRGESSSLARDIARLEARIATLEQENLLLRCVRRQEGQMPTAGASQVQSYAGRLRTLHSIAKLRTDDHNTRIDVALAFAVRELGLEQAYFGSIDTSLSELVMQNVVAPDAEPSYGPGKRYPLSQTLIGRVVESDDVLATPDVVSTKTSEGITYTDEWRCYVATSIKVHDKPYGAIGFLGRTVRTEPFSEFDTEFVRVTGDLITSAIEAEIARANLHEMAFHDLLTGLPNRALLGDRLRQCVLSAKREDSCFAVLFLDIDGFKAVNDSLGHAGGDKLLKEIARRLQSSARQEDTVARLGGDEFVILASLNQNARSAEQLTERIEKAFHNHFTINGRRARISVSIGVGLYPQHGHDAETLLAWADNAMFQAKAKRKIQAPAPL